MFTLRKLFATGISLFIAFDCLSQGVVGFVNGPLTVSTNASAIGGGIGITTGPPGSFYYGLFLASSSVTTIDSSLQGLLSPTWTFSGAYGTNIVTPGHLVGDSVINGWLPSETNTYLILGWSGNMGHDWTTISNLLNGAVFSSGVWGCDFTNGTGYLGASFQRADGSGLPFGAAGTAGSPLNLFGFSPTSSGTPALGFQLFPVVGYIPEPAPLRLSVLGALFWILSYRWQVVVLRSRCGNQGHRIPTRGAMTRYSSGRTLPKPNGSGPYTSA